METRVTSPDRTGTAGGSTAAMPGGAHRWRAFSLLAVAYFMTIVDLTIVNVALPTIGRKLHFPESDLQWVVTAYGLTFGGFLLLGGRAADLLGRRRLFSVGLVIFTGASLACALATTDTFLIIMRGIQGLGAAVLLPAGLSIVMNMFSEGAERNKALSAWSGIGATAATVGLLTGGLLTRYADWRYIFYLNVPIGATALLLTQRIVPESRLDVERRRYDPLGAITVTGALVLLVYAISQAPTAGWASARTLAMLAASAILLAIFLVAETRAQAPLLPLRLFRLKTLAGSNAVSFLLGASFFSFFFTGTLYMQQVLGYSALKTGIAWLATSLTALALAGPAQILVTRTSGKLVMAAGMTMVGAGILWATQASAHGHYWANLAGPLFVAGGAVFAFIPVSIGALAGIAEHDAGIASGLLNTSQQIGGAIGVAIASTVAATHSRLLLSQGKAVPEALTGGFHWAFWVTGITGLAAVPVTFLLIRHKELIQAIEAATQQPAPVPVPADLAHGRKPARRESPDPGHGGDRGSGIRSGTTQPAAAGCPGRLRGSG
jgi:EmrB/QacA subfamily drug resistance transporter